MIYRHGKKKTVCDGLAGRDILHFHTYIVSSFPEARVRSMPRHMRMIRFTPGDLCIEMNTFVLTPKET